MKRPDTPQSLKELRSTTVLRWPSLSYATLPLVIMVLTGIVILIGYSLANLNLEESRKRSIERILTENKLRIDGSFDSYAHLLWGSTGKLQTSGDEEGSWSDFVSAFNLRKNFTGIESLGFTRGLTPTNQVLIYGSPRTSATDVYIGQDIGKQPILQDAMKQAAESGEAKMSVAIPDLLSTKGDITGTSTGFLLFAPYYSHTLSGPTPGERLQELRGYTIALFRGDIFFQRIFKDTDMSHTRLSIYAGDIDKKNLLYDVGQTKSHDTRTATQKVDYYGRTLTLVYVFDTANLLSWWLTFFPQILVVIGLLIGMIFAGVAGYLLRSRYRRLTYEKERDVNFAKDELLSLASHQLRTPATGVKQYLGMMLQGFAGDLNPQQQTYLERAYNSNNRQLQVINDILHLAKLEAGRIVLAEHKFDIADMVREVIDEQREDAEKGELILRVTTPPRGMIVGDSHMLRMVVENLISNAIKYTPPKGRVTVKLSHRSKSWVLTVKDTGVGIADRDLPKLFRQFSRIHNTRSDFVTGTGIGLYLAYHLVVLHEGSIGVSSTVGKGSTFTVRLPRKM